VYYPGDAYCDLVGLDNYTDDVVWDGYEELLRTGKPFAATEFGPDKESGRFDYTRLVRAIRDRYPRTVYVLCWGTQWALANNRNAAAFLEDRWVVTRDGLPMIGTDRETKPGGN
jgi:mannan endo-1,4-beta-mannosidase